MGVYPCLWIFLSVMGVYGYLWVSGCLWATMRVYMGDYGYMIVYGYSWGDGPQLHRAVILLLKLIPDESEFFSVRKFSYSSVCITSAPVVSNSSLIIYFWLCLSKFILGKPRKFELLRWVSVRLRRYLNCIALSLMRNTKQL